MWLAWIRDETTQNRDRKRDIRSSGHGKEEERANSIPIGVLGHLRMLLIVLGCHRSAKMQPRQHRSRNSVAVSHPIAIQHVYDVLALGKLQNAFKAIPGDLHAQNKQSLAQIAQFEVF